jgi:transcription elongation factor Elf1
MYGTPYTSRAKFNCPHCHDATWHVQSIRDVNHIFHLLFTVLLCGLWLPVWLIFIAVGSQRSHWQCDKCGGYS